MADARKTIYERQAVVVMENLRRRDHEAVYCADAREAIGRIRGMIPAGSVVGLGGSTTVVETGLVDELRKMDIKLLDRYREGVTHEEVRQMRKQGLMSDVYIASANALTHDGRIICEDGLGNRVAAIIYGPEKVILMVGMNKLVPTVDDGIKRIKTIAAPFNSIRFGVDTPCSRTGICDDEVCVPPERICSQIAIIENSMVKNRITVVLVGESLGF